MMRTTAPPHFKSRILGDFIRKRRETLGLSQRALGQLFAPPVTTQFISNLERGVTPLPPVHVSTLAGALKIPEADLTFLMEKEYALRLNQRLAPGEPGDGSLTEGDSFIPLWVRPEDGQWVECLYRCFASLDIARKTAFRTLCAQFFGNPELGKIPRQGQQQADPQ